MAFVIVQAKSTQKFPRLFLSPNPSYAKNQVKMVPKQVFTGAGFKSPFSIPIPEAPSCRVNAKHFFINNKIRIGQLSDCLVNFP